jgi:hypothetical protein
MQIGLPRCFNSSDQLNFLFLLFYFIYFLKRGCPGWGANPGPLDYQTFSLLNYFNAATHFVEYLSVR